MYIAIRISIGTNFAQSLVLIIAGRINANRRTDVVWVGVHQVLLAPVPAQLRSSVRSPQAQAAPGIPPVFHPMLEAVTL